MNFKLIMLPNPILVSDEKDSGKVAWCPINNRLQFFASHPRYEEWGLEILAGIEGLPKLDLSAIAEKIGWVDVEKLAKEYTGEGMTRDDKKLFAILCNYGRKLLSLNEKKYSLEDMMLCWDSAQSWREDKNTWEKFIQSLSYPKEYNVELEMEDKIALDGHTVIGKEPKITNNTIKVTKILNN